jgi:hypothetical protein
VPAFEPADRTTSLPVVGFEFAPAADRPARELLAAAPADLLTQLLHDQESPVALLVARYIIGAFLPGSPDTNPVHADPVDANQMDAETRRSETGSGIGDARAEADAIAEQVLALRAELSDTLSACLRSGPEITEAVLRQRAPIALLAGCWLDTVSQPATQPAIVVNRLFSQHFRLHGEGNPQRAVQHLRRRALEQAGVYLPDLDAADFVAKARSRPLTALHALFYLSLSRLPASFLPEVVGLNYAFHALGLDDTLLGLEPRLDDASLHAGLAEYLELTGSSPTGAADRRRLRAGVDLVMRLEREQAELLDELARWQADLPLEAKVAAIIQRHAPFAGAQHRDVRVGGRRLADVLDDPGFDLADFVRTFRNSRQLKPIHGGDGRFLRAIKFGGPMFGIFDQREAEVFELWAEQAAAGELPDVELVVDRCGDVAAARWSAALTASDPTDVVFVQAPSADDRELFHRIVNIESFPNMLPVAHATAEANLSAAEVLFATGAEGKYTDASYFDYTPDGLLARVDRIYWDKLVNPYQPLTEIPDRDEVIFGQKRFALGSLIDGTWAHRIGNLGRDRPSDGMLASIYADEMGRGDVRKNHITLIYQVLRSMDIDLPHIRDVAFLDQGELPDQLYGFSVHQASLALFPDTFYSEILGYNLGIEMFGLGELRLHEIQKLRHHGLDPIYEEAHLSIDNLSAGHARQSAEIIVSYLDGVARTVGAPAVQAEWRRIWRGYASFAYFVEHALVREATKPRTAEVVI